jgi:hypothetical protein
MQDYYEQHLPNGKTHSVSFQLAFTGTIANVLINILGPASQMFVNYVSPRKALFISVILCSAGLVLAGFSTEVLNRQNYIEFIVE